MAGGGEKKKKNSSRDAASPATEKKNIAATSTESRMKGAAEAVKSGAKREKPVKVGKKKEEKSIQPVKRKEWPKGPLTTQQKIYYYGGLVLRAMGPLLLYATIPSLCLMAGYVLGGYSRDGMDFEDFFVYGTNFYTTIGTFVTLWILDRMSRRRGSNIWQESTMFVREMRPVKAIGFLIFGFASATAVSAFLTFMPEAIKTLGYAKATETLYMNRDVIFKMFTMICLAPLLEEMIFRGFMLNTFLEHIPEKKAILITGIIFAVMHGNVVWMLYAFVIGMILAQTAMKEDNIAYGVLLHSGFNATSIVNYFITNDPVKNQMYFGSKGLILVYGIAGLAISLFLAAVYTGRLDLKIMWRKVVGR